MKLRSYLVLMILGAILPVAVFGAIAGVFLAQRESETFRRGAHDRVLAVGTAIDLELRSSIDTLHALALAPSLEQGDLRYFRQAASTLLAAHPDWTNINLALPSGQQVMNLMVPDGEPLPDIGALDGSFERLVRSGEPVISDLAVGPVLKRWSFAVRVPVFEKDALKYVLSAGVKLEAINRIVDAQDLPRDWVGVVIDRNGRIVARNLAPEQTVGRLASQSLRDGLAREPSGWFRGSTIEGTDVYTPYRRSPVTGWSFAMGIPAYAVDAGTRRAAWLVVLWLAGAVGAAFLLAHFMSRRISGPIASLASAVEAVGRGSQVEPPAEPRIDEIRLLAAALRSAAQAARERQDLVAREKEALQAADRAKDEFLAMLGHELRNPLAALSAAAHVLKVADPARESAIKARRVVERQTKQMARLIEDLLDISRITMGKATLERELLDLAQVASNLLHTWRSAGRLDGARVSLQVMPAWVNADRVRIEQILSNLLDNALKFTPAGQPVVVSVRPEGGDAVLRVSDEGEGISPDMLGRVFDLFTQGPHGPDRAKGGLGLGLALVKRLAEMHGGSVSAASEGLGRGAVVTVRLPAVDGPQTQPAASGRARRAAGARRVLVIEDNDDARQMLRATLALAGHEVREAPDGMSGIAAAADVRPDVVLVDIGLPDIDGYEVARRLRSSAVDGKMALIAVTGYGQAGDERRALEAGFDAHLTKPVEPERLAEVIATLP